MRGNSDRRGKNEILIRKEEVVEGGHHGGSWKVAYADFVSPNLPLSKGLKQGAQEPELTVGVNWYLNDYTRVMFNYVFVAPVDPNAGPSTAQAFFLRMAIFW